MLVTVHLHTILQKPTDHGLVNRLLIELPDGAQLADLIEHLEIELEPEALLLAVNGRVADPERQLEDGDQVNLMPAISGGGARVLNEHSERNLSSRNRLGYNRAFSHFFGGTVGGGFWTMQKDPNEPSLGVSARSVLCRVMRFMTRHRKASA